MTRPEQCLSRRVLQFPIRRFKRGWNGFQVAVDAHQLLQDLDPLLTRLVHRPPDLLAVVVGLLLRVGKQAARAAAERRRAALPTSCLERFLGFVVLGFHRFLLRSQLGQLVFAASAGGLRLDFGRRDQRRRLRLRLGPHLGNFVNRLPQHLRHSFLHRMWRRRRVGQDGRPPCAAGRLHRPDSFSLALRLSTSLSSNCCLVANISMCASTAAGL